MVRWNRFKVAGIAEFCERGIVPEDAEAFGGEQKGDGKFRVVLPEVDVVVLQVDQAKLMLAEAVKRFPEQAERELARYRALLDETAKKTAPPNPAKHKEAVDKWVDLAGRWRDLFKPSDGKLTRVVSAVDNESTKQFFFRIEAE